VQNLFRARRAPIKGANQRNNSNNKTMKSTTNSRSSDAEIRGQLPSSARIWAALRFELSTHRLRILRLGLLTALALLAHVGLAQTWQTVDDFQYVAGQSANNGGMTIAPNGTLLAAGDAYDAAGVGHGLIMSSADGGATWSPPLDDFTGPILGDDPRYLAVGPDSAGNLYAAGTYSDAADPNITDHWFVRRSADGGATWLTVDDVAPFSGSWFNQANAIAADGAGNVYVVGYMNTISTGGAWIVRKSAGGASFSTVDSLPSNGGIIGATAVFVHPTAGIFVAGQADVVIKGVTVRAWIVRRSTNAGATWSTVDTFYGTKGSTYYFGRAYGVGTDARGNLYAAGALAIPYKGSAVWEWILRKSTNGGGTWSTVDTYQLAPTGNSVAASFVADSKGNLYVTGHGNTTYYGPNNWIVRQNPDGTGVWSTVDNFQYLTGVQSMPTSIAANAAGNVFVGGSGNDGTGLSHWLVRRR